MDIRWISAWTHKAPTSQSEVVICCHVLLFSYILKATSGNFDLFRHRVIHITIFAAEKVGGACSHLGTI